MTFSVTFVQNGERMIYRNDLADAETADALRAWLAVNGYYFDAAGQMQAPADVLTEGA